ANAGFPRQVHGRRQAEKGLPLRSGQRCPDRYLPVHIFEHSRRTDRPGRCLFEELKIGSWLRRPDVAFPLPKVIRATSSTAHALSLGRPCLSENLHTIPSLWP